MKILSIGELLLRFTVPDNLRFTQAHNFRMDVGGSEANVAIALSQLGCESQILSALPDSELGDRIVDEIDQLKVESEYIYRIGERIGLYYLEEGNSIRGSKIIYDRANSSINELTPDLIDWEKVLNGVTHLHWSAITPALSANSAAVCEEAVNRAHELGITISCDLHFRKNLWSYGKKPTDIIPKFLKKSTIVLGDPSTIEALTGIEMTSRGLETIESVDQLESDYRRFMADYPQIQYVSMLLRTVHSANRHELKAVMVSKNSSYESTSINVDSIKDRIGGGDAYMAGLLFGLHHYYNKITALEFAKSISALKHTIRGDYFRGNLNDVEQIMNSSQLGKINR